MSDTTVNHFVEDLKSSIETENPGDLANVAPDSKFQELNGWDSLATLSLIALLSEKYKVEMNAEAIKNCTTVQELFDLIRSHQ